MAFPLPAKSDSLRRTIERSHNRRVIILLAIMLPFWFVGAVFAKSSIPSWWIVGVFWGLAILVYIFGFIYLNRLSKQHSVTLGFVCPLCGAGLYSATVARLWIRGECPHCKQAIIEMIP
jgi:purine-cytosine permease-like protein